MAHDVMEQVRRNEMTPHPPAGPGPLGDARHARQAGPRDASTRSCARYARLEPSSKVVVSGNLDRAEVWCEELYERVAASGRGELAGGQE